jgi:PAS domain S-box/diguanylate cyclase (GGDEF) domain
VPATVGGRLAATLVPAAVILLSGAVAVGWAAQRQDSQAHGVSQHYEEATFTQQVAINWLQADALTVSYFINPLNDTRLAVQAKEGLVSQDLQRLQEINTANDPTADLPRIQSTIAQTTALEEGRASVMNTVDQGDHATAETFLGQESLNSGPALTQLQKIADAERQEILDLSAQSARTAHTMAFAIGGALIAIVLLGLIAAVAIARSVVRPLAHLRDTARDIGSGDLSARAKDSGPREIRELADVLNTTAASIQQREGALRASEAYWRSIIQHGQDIITVFNTDFSIAYQSPAALRILGYTEQERIEKSALSLIHPGDLAAVQDSLVYALSHPGEVTSVEFRIKKKNGEWCTLESIGSLVDGPDGKPIIIFSARDITERKEAAETMAHMAFHDALTGLPNRLLFADRLDVALAQARRNADKVCLISIDLDRFKIINDTLGHAAGDELLHAAAGRLEKLVREGNTVARIGGDEFIILLASCESAEDGITVAQRLVEAFRLPFTLEAGSYHSTASVGLSVYPDDRGDALALLRAADIAMYAAKDAGRDTFRRFTSAMSDKGAGWLVLESELRRAIERDELRVYYQPQIDIGSNQIVGAEALVRWQHPTRGLIAPMEFIPLAEEIGLIVPLGDFVLRHACHDAVQWQRDGLPEVRVAVNISHRQISDQRFVSTVRQIVAESGLRPSLLELEITETAALRNIERTRAVAIGLAEMGVRLSIDDFGAGSTSLRYLQDFPITTLKIDRSFITGVNHNPSNSAIVTSVIALGHQLHLNVIAEGVETQEDLDFLKSRDCDEYQGFFCSRPVPLDELKRLLAADHPSDAQPVTVRDMRDGDRQQLRTTSGLPTHRSPLARAAGEGRG